jgi:hypothetical protein
VFGQLAQHHQPTLVAQRFEQRSHFIRLGGEALQVGSDAGHQSSIVLALAK